MPRPKSKEELLSLAQSNYESLVNLIESYSREEQVKEFPEGTLNRNIRDVIAHLHHWHLMMFEWYTIGMNGEKPDMPAKGYTWKTISDLNRKIQKDYSSMDLNDSKKRFKKSHLQLYRLIEKHSNEELFVKKRYAWTASTSLGEYLISNSSSHYDWAYKLIRKVKRMQAKNG